MAKPPHSRRVFLRRLTFMGGGVVLLGGPGCEDRDGGKPAAKPKRGPLITSHLSFTNEEFATLAAACERILPKDEDPGALELGVPRYIDKMLQTGELRQMKQEFLDGLRALHRRALGVGKPFAELTVEQQDELLRTFKDSPAGSGEEHFYELLLALTLEGYLGDPSYGGNKDRAGWKLVGFDTSAPGPGYDGSRHLRDPRPFGGGGGKSGGCH